MQLHIDEVPASLPEGPPSCKKCRIETTLRSTRVSNRNGNSRRPYYKCLRCDIFHCFADQRGNNPGNPPCFCKIPSRLQVSNKDKPKGRRLHYVCRSGVCDFFDLHQSAKEEITVDDDLVAGLIRLLII